MKKLHLNIAVAILLCYRRQNKFKNLLQNKKKKKLKKNFHEF